METLNVPKTSLAGILLPHTRLTRAMFVMRCSAHSPRGLTLPRSWVVLNRAGGSPEGRVLISYVTTGPIANQGEATALGPPLPSSGD